MFVLVDMKDTVIVQPKQFGMDLKESIENDLNGRFSNKVSILIYCLFQVVYGVGLCIALWDITKIEESFIFPGDGACHTVVYFRYVVFRPFIDEVIIGTVKNCSQEGIQVTMTFFDDIMIPPQNLPDPSKFSIESGAPVWVWSYDSDGEVHDLTIEKGDTIRFRVVEEFWSDSTPSTNQPLENQPDTRPQDDKSPPYSIVGSISSAGLGLTVWWNNSE